MCHLRYLRSILLIDHECDVNAACDQVVHIHFHECKVFFRTESLLINSRLTFGSKAVENHVCLVNQRLHLHVANKLKKKSVQHLFFTFTTHNTTAFLNEYVLNSVAVQKFKAQGVDHYSFTCVRHKLFNSNLFFCRTCLTPV